MAFLSIRHDAIGLYFIVFSFIVEAGIFSHKAWLICSWPILRNDGILCRLLLRRSNLLFFRCIEEYIRKSHIFFYEQEVVQSPHYPKRTLCFHWKVVDVLEDFPPRFPLRISSLPSHEDHLYIPIVNYKANTRSVYMCLDCQTFWTILIFLFFLNLVDLLRIVLFLSQRHMRYEWCCLCYFSWRCCEGEGNLSGGLIPFNNLDFLLYRINLWIKITSKIV